MIRFSTKMFMLSVALWCIAAISYINTSNGFLPNTFAASMLQVTFIIVGVGVMAFGLIFRFAERAIHGCPKPGIAVQLTLPLG